jgi:hypothetical protein
MLDFIEDCLPESKEYPMKELIDSGLRLEHSIMYCYVPSTFLNGIINYVTPVETLILDRYHIDGDEDFKCNPLKLAVHAAGPTWVWETKEVLTKKEAFALLDSGYEMYHTNLRTFDDDVLMLAETEKLWWFFWFDMDSSDCCVGCFDKGQDKDQVISAFERYAKDISDGDVYEFKPAWIKGWISF